MTVQSIVCVQHCTNELSARGKADITTNTLTKSLYNNLHPLIKNDSSLFCSLIQPLQIAAINDVSHQCK